MFAILACEIFLAMATWVAPRDGDVARYWSIAQDIAEVAGESPVFEEPGGVRRTALLMASVASLESSYRADVDSFSVRGDGGKSWGLLQVQLRPGERCGGRVECLRVGAARVKESMGACRHTGDPMALFMSGPRCLTSWGTRERWARAKRWMVWGR
jgi:hypothetical protein